MIRLQILKGIVLAGLLGLAAGLFQTQILKTGYYRNLSEHNRMRLIPLEAPRGRVLDRAGRLLANNRPAFHLVATPEDVTPEVFPRLAKLLKVPESVIREKMSGEREYPFAPVILAQDISRDLLFRFEELRPELPGVSVQREAVRFYPYGRVASHLVGYVGKISLEEYRSADRNHFGFTSLVGRAGLEKTFDSQLRGWRGGRQIEVNARGEQIRLMAEKVPVPGDDVTLTIDLEFQRRLTDLVQGKKATIAFLDLKTEEFLALASNPGFDPNVFVSPRGNETRLRYLHDADTPLVHRGMSAAYPPGSIFKLVTALAGLESGKITAFTTFHCPGYFKLNRHSRRFHCWMEKGHGTLDLYRALERSCNVYFYNVGRLVGPDALAKMARTLGLGQTFDLEMRNVAPGLVPDSVWKREHLKQPWWPGETLSFAVGQGYLLVTPLQILRLVAIIAKNGEWIEPKLIREPGRTSENLPRRVAVQEKNLKIIRQGMLKVVESDFGTGQLARVDFDQLAGKTGTAQAPPRDPHAWMTGFFPYRDPQVAFVVFVEHGGSGGITAARIVKQAIQIWQEMFVKAPAAGVPA